MQNAPIIEVQKWVLQVLNNVCEIERKLAKHGDPANARRNLERIREAFEEQRVFFEDPMGQEFNETRTDLEASIAGSGSEALRVVEVIKPIIRIGDQQYSKVVQKGIVVVESTKPSETEQSSKGEQQ